MHGNGIRLPSYKGKLEVHDWHWSIYISYLPFVVFPLSSDQRTLYFIPSCILHIMTSNKTLCLGYDGIHPFSKVEIKDRSSVQELLRTVLDPLEPFFSPGKARVKCPGATAVRFDQTASEVEGICRPMWGLAALLAGGGDYDGKEWWIQGIKSGTDPESPEYWGYPQDNDQRMVEMCPLGKEHTEC